MVAACALADEDLLLRNGIEAARQSAVSRNAFDRVGAGLSYWLYETTLVYIIWRSWMLQGEAAAWDWTAKDLSSAQSPMHDAAREQLDLVLLGERGPRFIFEVKWWNDPSTKTRSAIEADINKLRRFSSSASTALLLFWLETKAQSDGYEAEVAQFAKMNSLTNIGRLSFPASFREDNADQLGQFVIACLLVNP